MKRLWLRELLILQLLFVTLAAPALAALPERLVPVGSTVGIRLEADGPVVVGFDEERSAAREAGMQKGDVVKTVNGTEVQGCEDFKSAVASAGGLPLELGLLRDGKPASATVSPERDGQVYRLGLLLRDSMAGIGTVTFYDPDTGLYGALGHGVNELRSSILLPLASGEIVPSRVVEVERGAGGAPGILKGEFDAEETLGAVEANTERGIFGHSEAVLSSRDALPVAAKGEIHTGTATILANVSGDTVEEYQVEIVKLFPAGHGRDLLLTIKDPRLLRATGGIVQGMSGSPIIQDGQLIGAVTHVLVDDPVCGYGIFIEDMLEDCEGYRDAA